MDIAIVPVIVALVYGIIEIYKYVIQQKENWLRFIPVIAAVLGAILGVVAFYVSPEIIAADNVLVAVLIGGASGLAATGTNQIFKQLGKFSTPTEKEEGNSTQA